MKTIIIALSFLLWPVYGYSGICDHPDDITKSGRRCGGSAASIRPGGRLGGDGKYKASSKKTRRVKEQAGSRPQSQQKKTRHAKSQFSRRPQSQRIKNMNIKVIKNKPRRFHGINLNTCGFGYPAFDKNGRPNCLDRK